MTAAVVLTMPPRPLADGRAELLDCALSVIRDAETHKHQDVVNACFYLREYGGPTGGVLAVAKVLGLKSGDIVKELNQ